MTLNLTLPEEEQELKPRITVVGVGGAGGNAVNNMIRSNLSGVEFVICNTDAQAMKQNLCEARIQMGIGVTRGLGAGSRPDVGRAAAGPRRSRRDYVGNDATKGSVASRLPRCVSNGSLLQRSRTLGLCDARAVLVCGNVQERSSRGVPPSRRPAVIRAQKARSTGRIVTS